MQKSYFIYYIVPKKIMTVNQIDLLMASGILVWARGTMSSNVASNTCRQGENIGELLALVPY